MDGNALLSNKPLAESEPVWRRLLTAAVRGSSKQAVASRLGISRPYVSRVMSGDIHPVPAAFIERVMARYYVVAKCPATDREQPRSECSRIALAAAPTHNPMSMRIWKTCQTCPHKPEVQS